MNKEERLKDYIRRWGNAQQCPNCGYITPYGTYEKKQKCCGKEMPLVIKVDE